MIYDVTIMVIVEMQFDSLEGVDAFYEELKKKKRTEDFGIHVHYSKTTSRSDDVIVVFMYVAVKGNAKKYSIYIYIYIYIKAETSCAKL